MSAEEEAPLLTAPAAPEDAATERHQAAASSAASGGGGGGGASAPEQPTSQHQCRICLQEDDIGSLVAPCRCAGSMQWAHVACLQRWIDEKHDKKCELCGQLYQGDFTDPPPAPPRHPVVAQLQVDNADRRIVLLADPETGNIVARVVIPPNGDLRPDLERLRLAHALAAAEEEDEEDEEGEARACRRSGLVAAALLLVFMLGAFAWIAAASEEGHSEAAASTGAWVVRAALLTAWISLRMMHPVYRAPRRADHGGERLVFPDLEAGLPRNRGRAAPS